MQESRKVDRHFTVTFEANAGVNAVDVGIDGHRILPSVATVAVSSTRAFERRRQ